MSSVLDRVTVADVLRLANVTTEQRGTRIWFCCPCHDDHHPSAVIVNERGWCCHVCKAKGGVFDLVIALALAQDRAAAARFLELAL